MAPPMTPRVVALLALCWLAACGEPDPATEEASAPVLAFDSTRIRLVSGSDTILLRVELATTPDQRALGLMERDRLPPDAGMLFLYDQPQPAEAGFWMFRTRIPLDIAFVDDRGEIVAVRAMEPCPSPDARWCPSYEPGVPYRAALEVNRGYFQRHGIGVGDRVLLPPVRPSTPGAVPRPPA